MTDKLNFLVKEDIWLAASDEPEFKILGWTTIKPSHDNGYIKKNSALIFNHIYEDVLVFVMIQPGAQYEEWYAEFSQKEIEYLTNEGALELIKMIEIPEADIAPGPGSNQGPILIRDSRLFELNKEAILPNELYVVMGQKENMQSNGVLVPGEKISLRHILDNYSTALGKKLISKEKR